MSHKYVLLKEVCEKASSNIAQKDLAECDGIYPIYGASGYIKSVDFFQQAKDYIAIVKDGAGIGRAMKLPAKSSVIGTMQYVLPKDNINISYLYYAICSMHLEKYFSGATIPHIYFRDYQNEQLPLPTLEEQAKIANVFGRIDYFIKKEKEQLINLDKLVKSRFIEMFGNEENNFNNIPITEIGEHCKVQGGYAFRSKDFTEEGIRLVQIGNVNKDSLDWEVINYLPMDFAKYYPDYLLKNEDLLIAMTRPIIKSIDCVKIAMVSDKDIPSLLNQRVGRFMVDENIINKTFLLSLLKMRNFKIYVDKMSGNSLQPNISSKQIEEYKIPVPPLELQNQFADFVTQVNKSKFVVTAKFQ